MTSKLPCSLKSPVVDLSCRRSLKLHSKVQEYRMNLLGKQEVIWWCLPILYFRLELLANSSKAIILILDCWHHHL